jgi:hypothetical protein
LVLAAAIFALAAANFVDAVPGRGIGPDGIPPGHGGIPPGLANKNFSGSQYASIPEPGTLALSLLGIAGLAYWRLRKPKE